MLLKNIIITAAALMLACKPTVVETPVEDSEIPVEEEKYSWATWETCGQSPGEHPCNFTLTDQNSETVELYQHYGKVIVLDFSAMWCGVCHNIATMGETFATDYGSDKVIWLTILIDDTQGNPPDAADLMQWVEAYNVQLPVLAGSRDMIDLSAKEGYPISSWPTIVVIDREMVLLNGINGWNETTVRAWVESLL